MLCNHYGKVASPTPLTFLCRGSERHTPKPLLCARQKAHSKPAFADACLICRVAFAEDFAVSKMGFAMCPCHTANFWNPVVYQTQMQGLAAHHVVLMKLRAHLQFSRYSRVLFNFYFYLCFSFIHAYNSVLLIFFLPVVTFFSR